MRRTRWGCCWSRLGKPQEAVDWLARAARGMPRNARAHYNLGLLLQQLGRLDEAAQALEAAVDIEPQQSRFPAGAR